MSIKCFKIFALSMTIMLLSASSAYAGINVEKSAPTKGYKNLKETSVIFKHKGPKVKAPKVKSPKTKNPKVTCPVVKKPVNKIGVKEITLNKTKTTIAVGSWERLVAVIKPANAENKHVLWYSTRPDIATVNPSGKVTGIRAGEAVIYAVSRYDFSKKARCTVTVKTSTSNPTPEVTGIYLNKKTTTLTVGSSETLTATVVPGNLSSSVKWYSGNPDTVSVNQSGRITAKRTGTARIFAMTSDGKFSASCLVKVIPKDEWEAVDKVKLNLLNIIIPVGEKDTLKYSVEPADASNQEVVWTSSSTNVVSVSSTGVIEAKHTGTAIVTATSKDGSKKATCTVTVVPALEKPSYGIMFNKISSTLIVGMSDYPTVNVYPSGTSISSLSWSSSNSSVATVNKSGRVTAVAPGNAVITVRTSDGRTASYVVIVTK